MCNTVVIAGILTAWPVGETSVEETRGMQERPQGARATALHIHTPVVPAMMTREVERVHAGMRTKKTTDAINQIPAQDIPADAINRVPAHTGVLDFGTLYEKFSRPIHSYIYRLLGSQEDADDVTQEVFTRAYISW